jgi:hypothetical protein
MQWQRHKARNNGEPGKRAMAAGLPSGAALRQVWGCKVAAQPMEQTAERRTYSRPKEAPLFSCGQADTGGFLPPDVGGCLASHAFTINTTRGHFGAAHKDR